MILAASSLFENWTWLHWALVGLMAALYVLSCFRLAWTVRRNGRNPWGWFLITLLGTPIPVAIVLHRDAMKAKADLARAHGARSIRPDEARACPHCRQLLPPADRVPGGLERCPFCNERIDPRYLA
jgi:hypothetical protein